jgi:hypothetical protein
MAVKSLLISNMSDMNRDFFDNYYNVSVNIGIITGMENAFSVLEGLWRQLCLLELEA